MSIPAGVFTSDWYEHDERWSQVDSYSQSHLHPSTHSNHDILSAALEHSIASGLPDIATQPVFSKLMALQCRAGKVKHALEIGTLGGYTPIWLATMNPDIRVTSLEVDLKHAQIARENIERAGVSDRVEVIVGPALETLPRLKDEIQRGTREPFGFTYIDADKINNWTYFDLAVGLSHPSAFIYVDNVVRMGTLVSEKHIAEGDEGCLGGRTLIENVGKDGRVEAVVQQTVSGKTYDGYLFAVVL